MFSPVGLDWDSISECVEWMVPFVNVARKVSVKLKHFKKVAVEDCHNIQTHTNYLDMLVGGLQACALYSPSPEVLKVLQANDVTPCGSGFLEIDKLHVLPQAVSQELGED